MLDLSPLFYTSPKTMSYLGNLEVPEEDVTTLLQARRDLREFLRRGVNEFSKTEAGGHTEIAPKFHTQGSWAYKTANAPCHKPPQQVDYDDGMYLPVSYLDNGRPSAAAKVYFSIVDGLISKLCKNRGWEQDQTKKTCSRVIISDHLHIDVPLYSIPDSEFRTLMEKAAASTATHVVMSRADAEFSEAVWTQLPSDRVMLAMRDGDWEPSDPRKLNDWFLSEVRAKGEQLRRMCRYVKAWRDHHWKQSGPSSIFLMVCVSELFQKMDGRDDLALHHVLTQLPNRLLSRVMNPRDASEDLSARQSGKDLQILGAESQLFADDLSVAIHGVGTSSADSCDLVREHLGNRFPSIRGLKHMPKEHRAASDAAGVLGSIARSSYPRVEIKKQDSVPKPWMQLP